ncbi:glycosyltransferase [Gelidibacter salicanalis]|uniref:Glycosyltransferase n=1 Tax=Gelidibacter salicanalis TaxID=291193 RepID=A0A934KXI1_9FLAO|nr:glycosyltransferase [Gelidibacter salicanalis]MBJ7882708.1 glycosyltransferase [Gelidibacter salicanalis]
MKSKIKVFFIIPNLCAGGAERVMSFVSQNLDPDRFDVTLIVIGFKKDNKYNIAKIPVLYLNKERVLHSFMALIKILREQKPKVVISAISHLNIFMGYISLLFPNIKFVGRHTIVSIVDKKFKAENKKPIKKRISKKLRRPLGFGYKFLDIILCQSTDMYNQMKFKSKVPEHKLKIINNPITDNFILKTDATKQDELVKFITVARISKNKGHKRILNVLSKLDYPFQYTIIGDGIEKDNVLKLIRKLGLENSVVYIPFTHEVPKHLAESDIYLMGSYSEGLPNSLIESCSVGTPALAFRAPGGLNEIIEDGVNGYLVDNESEYLEKLQQSHHWDKEQIRESVYRKFNKERIVGQYEELIVELSTK